MKTFLKQFVFLFAILVFSINVNAAPPTTVSFGFTPPNILIPNSKFMDLNYADGRSERSYFTADKDYFYMYTIPRPAGATTQWITLTFRSVNFFTSQQGNTAHVPIFLRLNDGAVGNPPKGKGIFLGRAVQDPACPYNVPGSPAYVFTEVTASRAGIPAPQPFAWGIRCSGVAIYDNVDYNLVMHVNDGGVAYQVFDTRTNQKILDQYVSDASYSTVTTALSDPGALQAYNQMNQVNTGFGFALLADYNPALAPNGWRFLFKNINSGWF